MSINDPVNLSDLLRKKLEEPAPSFTSHPLHYCNMDNVVGMSVEVANNNNECIRVFLYTKGVTKLAELIRDKQFSNVRFTKALRNKHRLNLLEAKRVADIFVAVAMSLYLPPAQPKGDPEDALVNEWTYS